MSYNGWSNYETWNINMWLDNSDYDYIQEMTRGVINRSTSKDDAINTLEDQLKEYIEDQNPLKDDSGVFSDLLQAAIDSADFREIAEANINELWEEEEEDEDLEVEEE